MNDRLSSQSFDWVVPLSAPYFAHEEVEAVSETVRSGWWTYGPVARALEQEFAEALRVPHAVAVSSGTAALHLALVALGVEPGDEVLTPSLSFVAAANTILHAGGIPRFVDVESPENPLVSARNLEQALTPRTRGICVMHYGGYPCRMDTIVDWARSRGLWVVEDAAHALGASWQEVPCGTWGDAGCFSFFGNKNVTCGEGGMLVMRSDRLAARVRSLRSHGMDSLTWDRYQGHSHSYDVSAAGFNYRIDDIRAALLRVQLRSLERIRTLRRERIEWYGRLLAGKRGWTVPFRRHEGTSACHLFVVVLDKLVDRNLVMDRLRDKGIQTSVHYPPSHLFSFYRKLGLAAADLSVTEGLAYRLLTLPLFPDMTHEQVRLVAEALSETAQEARVVFTGDGLPDGGFTPGGVSGDASHAGVGVSAG